MLLGFRVWGLGLLGFSVWDFVSSGFRVWGLGLLGFGVSGFRLQGFGIYSLGLSGFRLLGFRDSGLQLWALEYHTLILFRDLLLKGSHYETKVYTFFSLVTSTPDLQGSESGFRVWISGYPETPKPLNQRICLKSMGNR